MRGCIVRAWAEMRQTSLPGLTWSFKPEEDEEAPPGTALPGGRPYVEDLLAQPLPAAAIPCLGGTGWMELSTLCRNGAPPEVSGDGPESCGWPADELACVIRAKRTDSINVSRI